MTENSPEKGDRKERFVLFPIYGFTERLKSLAANRDDLILFENMDSA